MYYKDQLESIRKNMYELLGNLKKELELLPSGSLYIYEKRGRRQYCRRLPILEDATAKGYTGSVEKSGRHRKERRVSINNDDELILALVRKKYVETAIENVRRNIADLDDVSSNYMPVSEEAVTEDFLSKYPELKKGIFYGKTDPELWSDSYTPATDFYEDDLKSLSSQGEKMRSGGEMFIASRLDHFGIPYRYEEQLQVPELRYSPDFTILRPRDRKIFYWEHFGMVNDSDYIRKNIGKVIDYIDYGIRPWDNLIMTYNNEQGGLNGKLVDAMIECWLL